MASEPTAEDLEELNRFLRRQVPAPNGTAVAVLGPATAASGPPRAPPPLPPAGSRQHTAFVPQRAPPPPPWFDHEVPTKIATDAINAIHLSPARFGPSLPMEILNDFQRRGGVPPPRVLDKAPPPPLPANFSGFSDSDISSNRSDYTPSVLTLNSEVGARVPIRALQSITSSPSAPGTPLSRWGLTASRSLRAGRTLIRCA